MVSFLSDTSFHYWWCFFLALLASASSFFHCSNTFPLVVARLFPTPSAFTFIQIGFRYFFTTRALPYSIRHCLFSKISPILPFLDLWLNLAQEQRLGPPLDWIDTRFFPNEIHSSPLTISNKATFTTLKDSTVLSLQYQLGFNFHPHTLCFCHRRNTPSPIS